MSTTNLYLLPRTLFLPLCMGVTMTCFILSGIFLREILIIISSMVLPVVILQFFKSKAWKLLGPAAALAVMLSMVPKMSSSEISIE